MATYRSSSAEKPLSAFVRSLRIRYDALLKMTYTTASDSWAAVHSACAVYIALPSPTSATTGRFGSASFTPSAAGRPQPMPPPRRLKNDLASAQRKKLRIPPDDEIASSTMTTSSGTTCETACTRASGPIGDFFASSAAREVAALARVRGRHRLATPGGILVPGLARVAAHRLAELGQRGLRIALDRDGGGIVLAELPRIHVEVDDVEAVRHRVHIRRQREREEVAAHGEQQVVPHEQALDRRAQARHRAGVQRMREREAARRGHALQHHG